MDKMINGNITLEHEVDLILKILEESIEWAVNFKEETKNQREVELFNNLYYNTPYLDA